MGHTRVTLLCDGREGSKQILDLRTDELGSSSQGVAVLSKGPFILFDSDLLFVRNGECAVFQKVPNGLG